MLNDSGDELELEVDSNESIELALILFVIYYDLISIKQILKIYFSAFDTNLNS